MSGYDYVPAAFTRPGVNTATWERRVCEQCGRSFPARRSAMAQAPVRFCTRACFHAAPKPGHMGEDARAAMSESRRGPGNPNYKHGRRAGARSRSGERRFIDAEARACRHPRCRGRSAIGNQHHVVYRQEVVREGGDVWDADNALALCHDCHSSHHHRGDRVVPLTALRDENYSFARELLGGPHAYEYLRRRYAGDDPRLTALLDEED